MFKFSVGFNFLEKIHHPLNLQSDTFFYKIRGAFEALKYKYKCVFGTIAEEC